MQNTCFPLNYVTGKIRQIMQAEKIGYNGYFEIFTTILQPRRSQVPDPFSLNFFFFFFFFFFASGPIYAGIDAHFLTTILHANTPIACAQDRRLYPNLGQIGESEILFTRGLNLPEATILYGMHTVHQYLYQLKH
uniref:Uncharacterized protein n=1 Tax=Pipistrellus kuhlii TaxID=59472 RepID=A0A7J7TW80_PIPKU|nr:hypothetical protein mPipKuh1_009274 [Pipistrellus kuhlii]